MRGRGAIWVANRGQPLGFPSLAGGALQVSGDGGAVELYLPRMQWLWHRPLLRRYLYATSDRLPLKHRVQGIAA
jgi:hypothetical protein